MEDPRAFASNERLSSFIVDRVQHCRPDLVDNNIVVRSLSDLIDVLTDVNAKLEARSERLVIALDEYQFLDQKIGEGALTEDALRTFRTSIQEHRCLTWMFAGSSALDELHHADWSSYLVSARTVEVLPFVYEETYQLLTDPLGQSEVWRHDDQKPTFPPEFWGSEGIERIQQQTGGWPHLVQLVAETTVDLTQDGRFEGLARPESFEEVLNAVVARGDAVLRQLMRAKEAPGDDWTWLRGFERHDHLVPPECETVRRSLHRRRLVEAEGSHWRLRVPLMQRWLRRQSTDLNPAMSGTGSSVFSCVRKE